MKESKANIVDSITARKPFSFGKNKAADSLESAKKDTLNKVKAEPKKKAVKKEKERFGFFKFKKPRTLSIHGSLTVLVLLPILLFALVSYAYETHNEGRIYTGVYTFGVNVGGKSKEEAAKLIDAKVKGYKLTIEGENQKFEASYSDLGINYDKEKIINTAYDYGRDRSVLNNFLNRAKRYFSQYKLTLGSSTYAFQKHNVNLVYSVDKQKLDAYLAGVESKINIAPKDSEITTQGSSMQIVPAVFGKKLKTEELKQQILAASTKFESVPLKIQIDTASPTILDEQTRVLAEKADQVTSKKVVLTYQGKTYVPAKETVVSWVTFTREDDKSPWQMVIDPYKMTPYFQTLRSGINVYATDQKIRVENQTKEIVTQEGKNGLIIDEATLGSQISQKLQSNPSVSLEIPMKTDYFQTQKDYVVVANWDKYIDINISTQTMDAYLKGGNKVGSWAITSGRSGWDTPTGTFLITRKAYNVCMPNPPSTQPLCGIHYVSYFTGAGHAIHQAWWRSYFGSQDYKWNGSHGCINAPLWVAQYIYDWAPIGTPVTIHY
ncbi:hypothetical protein C4544_04160 [candidate division WS5 bacterium]|uniref:L,D-TPase catalytic domain-containing protein n=1 Tax=candidate division WS5 bacterium TaxID=2093353 RepID=A0A419DCW8_9BACT|nr:MAG: hypothetical protein C4544_04160 [candidate division WS5 bacterium]